jgi:Ca-activated chloride channel homolog
MIDGLRFDVTTFLILLGVLCGAIVYRYFFVKLVVYRYSLAAYMARRRCASTPFSALLYIIRVAILVVLAFLIARPQLPDKRTRVNVEGIDIMLVLDVSGSMACFDDMNDRRTRIDIAKQEALRFVEQRETDAIGLSIFGNGALSACPLTHDKVVLREIIQNLDLGTMVDERSTLLAHGMLVALNRLKESDAPTKVMILLTDGQPSVHDVSVDVPLAIAKKIGIKIYTIGIGDEQGGYSVGPHGMLMSEGVQLNDELLHHIAQQTGGVFYRARNAQDMHAIYDEIDTLEKRVMPVNLYARYYDIFEPFLWMLLIIVASELLLSTYVWKTL